MTRVQNKLLNIVLNTKKIDKPFNICLTFYRLHGVYLNELLLEDMNSGLVYGATINKTWLDSTLDKRLKIN